MLVTLATVLIALSLALSCLCAMLIVLHRRRIPAGERELPRYPKVSVLLTPRNLDDGLEENLASILSLHYPDFEVLFGIDALDDPCMPLVELVRSRFSHVRSTIVITGHSQASNPKASKLAQMEHCSDVELFWVVDADIRVAPDTLTALVGEYLRHDAKIVFSPIRCRGARSFGSVLEMSYINFFLSGSVLAAWNLLRRRIIVGKSLLVERQTLNRFGGFAYFTDVLAEDHWLGETFSQSGFPVRCNYTWVDNIKETSTIGKYFDRITRWAKLRYHLNRPVFLLEFLLNPLALTMLFLPLLQSRALPLVLSVVLMRLAAEYAVFFAINDHDRRRLSVIFALAPAVLVKDLLMPLAFCLPFFSSSVKWRNSKIRIGKYTLMPLFQEYHLYDGA